MGLPWVRLDTQFPSNPKVLELTSSNRWRAAFVYLTGLAYCGQHGTDGYLPEASLPFIHATKRDADELVKVGLWHTDIWAAGRSTDGPTSRSATTPRRSGPMMPGRLQ